MVQVITVRNPFSRLVSAYYDKMLPASPGYTYFYKTLSQNISRDFRHLRQNETERNQTYFDGNATFEDFVNYLLTIDIMRVDAHFLSFVARCKPCDAEYDYVIKFETMERDVEYLKQKLNISDYHRTAVFPRKKFKASMDFVKNTFKKVPLNSAIKLYKQYRRDFEIFGYEKPGWLC